MFVPGYYTRALLWQIYYWTSQSIDDQQLEKKMPDSNSASELISGLKKGTIVPYIGPGVLKGVKSLDGSNEIPADSDSLILAMNNGQPMAPRLMYEFPRAAMNMELKKGRSFVERFLTETYAEKKWQRSAFHDWLAEIAPPYVIDINRDTQLQDSYSHCPHTLIVGTARIANDYRFKLFSYDGEKYTSTDQEQVDSSQPILFKPMGTPIPEPTYIAADADYVDYITELMGGFAIPSFLKEYRMEKQYLLLGVNLNRDTERMVFSDIIYGAHKPAGWACIPEPTEKELRFCNNKNIQVLDMNWTDLVASCNATATDVA